MTTKKLIAAENRLVLALSAAAPAATIDLLRRRVAEAGGDPDSVIPAHAGDVTVPPMPEGLMQMLSELRARQKKVDELKAEQRQVEADLVEIQEELFAAERELREFVRVESRRRHPVTEPRPAA